MKNKGGIISLALGLLIVLTTDCNTGFFIPWYLHLIFGWVLLIYGTIRYFREIKNNKIVAVLILASALVSTYFGYSSALELQNDKNDGNHPFWDAETRNFTTINDEFKGIIKLKKDKIFIQLNETNGRTFDSVNVVLDDELLTSNQVFMTSILDQDGLFLRGSTRKKFFIDFRDYFKNQDTLRVGLDYNIDLFYDNEKSIQVKFYDNTSYLLTEKIK